LKEKLQQQTMRENNEQAWQKNTLDFKEGIASVSERRAAKFVGK